MTKTDTFSLPDIVYKTTTLHKEIYVSCRKLPKYDRFSIGKDIETESLGCLKLSIEAALSPRNIKGETIQKLRITIEVLKKFITLLEELHIIEYKKYIGLQIQLQEISKMAHGWLVSVSTEKG